MFFIFFVGIFVGFCCGAMLVALAVNDYRKAAVFCYRHLTDYDDVCNAVTQFPWLDDGYKGVINRD